MPKVSNAIIDWAFDSGVAFGDRNYWKQLDPNSPEWKDFITAVRGELVPYAFESGLALGEQSYWLTLAADAPGDEWNDLFRALGSKVPGSTSGTSPPPPVTPPVTPPPTPPPVIPPSPVPPPPPQAPPINYLERAQISAPWLPPELQKIYAEAWALYGDSDIALDAMRAHASYDSYYPGNRREDGSLRYDELGYVLFRTRFNNELIGYGLNPSFFGGKFLDLLNGDVSAIEFEQRMASAYTGLITNLPEIQAYYSQNYGLQLSEEAIFASFLDPDIGTQVLSQQILVSQVGGMAALHGFNVGIEWAGELSAFGVSQQQANQLFGAAEEQLPTLQQLAVRHNDPDDTFDLDEFVDAQVTLDPIQRNRMRRLLAQEASSFSGGANEAIRRSGDILTGLTAR